MLDPVFRQVTLENDRLKSLVRDLRYHEDPQGDYTPDDCIFGSLVDTATALIVLQSMVICKQKELGGEGMHTAMH